MAELAIDVSEDPRCTTTISTKMAAFQRLFRASLGPAAVVSAAAGVTATVAFADVGAAPETAVVNPGRTLRGDKVSQQRGLSNPSFLSTRAQRAKRL